MSDMANTSYSEQGVESGIPTKGFLADLISPDRVLTGVQVSSKKRLLEEVASLLSVGHSELDRDTIFQILNERERLGSTGIGEGIAIPHGRINGIDQPIVCAMLLAQPLEFEAIDDQPIRCVIGLIVPADANHMHLKILAKLAGIFSQPTVRSDLLCQTDTDSFYHCLTSLE
ncbi:MAG: PTS system nitrogen regulatory IIA component [Parasphingorhabdus sp.]|jgi:PTS system nitrogen regulatory IIA component